MKRGPYHDGYANLAAAIIVSGEKIHDQRFLESDWCELLREICILDDQMHSSRDISTRGRSVALTNKGGHTSDFN